MDTTWLLLGGLALLIVVAALAMLNRSWGSFPNRAGILPPPGASAPGMSRQEARAQPWGEQPDMPAQPVAMLDAAVPADLVPITHQLVRQAAERALERGGPVTRYIVRQGKDVYFDFSQIDDPAQRQEAYELMRRFNAGQDVDISAMVKMVRRLFDE
jgi:hypothetical protein